MTRFAALTFALLLAAGAAFGQPKSKAPKKSAPRKTTLCHVKGKQSKTIRVSDSLVAEHLAHGDRQGACR